MPPSAVSEQTEGPLVARGALQEAAQALGSHAPSPKLLRTGAKNQDGISLVSQDFSLGFGLICIPLRGFKFQVGFLRGSL